MISTHVVNFVPSRREFANQCVEIAQKVIMIDEHFMMVVRTPNWSAWSRSTALFRWA